MLLHIDETKGGDSYAVNLISNFKNQNNMGNHGKGGHKHALSKY